jgi:hypothetical protein
MDWLDAHSVSTHMHSVDTHTHMHKLSRRVIVTVTVMLLSNPVPH